MKYLLGKIKQKQMMVFKVTEMEQQSNMDFSKECFT